MATAPASAGYPTLLVTGRADDHVVVPVAVHVAGAVDRPAEPVPTCPMFSAQPGE